MQIDRFVLLDAVLHQPYQLARLVLNDFFHLKHHLPREKWVQQAASVLVNVVRRRAECGVGNAEGTVEPGRLPVLCAHEIDLVIVLGIAEMDFIWCDAYDWACLYIRSGNEEALRMQDVPYFLWSLSISK